MTRKLTDTCAGPNALALYHPSRLSLLLKFSYADPYADERGQAHTFTQTIISWLHQVRARILISERKGQRWISRKYDVSCIYSSKKQQVLLRNNNNNNYEAMLKPSYQQNTCMQRGNKENTQMRRNIVATSP